MTQDAPRTPSADSQDSAGSQPRPGSENARALYGEFAGAMAYVAVRTPEGTEGIGSAFHVGEGVFVTARHVVEGNEIVEVGTFARTYVRLHGEEAERSLFTVKTAAEEFKAHLVSPGTLAIEAGPFFHSDPAIDVAVFKVNSIDPYTPVVQLGDHLDDWLGQDDFVLTEVVILGFPPVPFAHGPHLFAARGEVNAQIDFRHAKHVHFIVSATPRGGFSGGLVLTQAGLALGVITQSLVMDSMSEQLGYMAALSVEPIYVCLAEHRLLPTVQSQHWDDFWNSECVTTVDLPGGAVGHLPYGLIEQFDDAKRFYLDVGGKVADRDAAVRAALEALSGFAAEVVDGERGVVRVTVGMAVGASAALALAAKAAALVLYSAGYVRSEHRSLLSDDDDLPF